MKKYEFKKNEKRIRFKRDKKHKKKNNFLTHHLDYSPLASLYAIIPVYEMLCISIKQFWKKKKLIKLKSVEFYFFLEENLYILIH